MYEYIMNNANASANDSANASANASTESTTSSPPLLHKISNDGPSTPFQSYNQNTRDHDDPTLAPTRLNPLSTMKSTPPKATSNHTTIAIASTSESTSVSTSTSPDNNVFFEPLKICLDSDGESDSSMTSSCCGDDEDDYLGNDDEDGCFFGFGPPSQQLQAQVGLKQQLQDQPEASTSSSPSSSPSSLPALSESSWNSCSSEEYFHKEPHKYKTADADALPPENDTIDSKSNTVGETAPIRSISSTAASHTSPSLSISDTLSLSPTHPPHLDSSSNSSDIDSSMHSYQQLQMFISTCSTSNKKTKLHHHHHHHHKQKRKKGRVSLNKSVAVIPIPSRFDYTFMVRERLWSSSAQLCTNAARNSVEYASEGWNWRNVLEDDKMLLHKASGELIHPIHVHNLCLSSSGNAVGNDDDNFALDLISQLIPNNRHDSAATTTSTATAATATRE
jgi:hypothetical protein